MSGVDYTKKPRFSNSDDGVDLAGSANNTIRAQLSTEIGIAAGLADHQSILDEFLDAKEANLDNLNQSLPVTQNGDRSLLSGYLYTIWARLREITYEFMFLVRTRAEKWVIIATFLLGFGAFLLNIYLVSMIERPSPIVISCDR